MQKNKLFTLSALLGLSLSLIGCGNSDTTAVTQTAETFLQAAMDCDVDIVSSNCLETVLTDIGLDAISPDFAEEIIYTNMQIEKASLSEEAQKAVSDFCTYYSGNIIQNFTVGEVTVENNVGYVNATVTTYSQDALSSLSGETFKNELSALMTIYQEENMQELVSISLNEGNDAMMIKIFDDLMPEIMDIMKKSYDSYTPEDINIVLTLEKTEENWIITKASITE